MMSDVIRQETTVFFLAIALGAGLSFFYDFLRVLRRMIRHGAVATGIEDLLFWLFGACLLFAAQTGSCAAMCCLVPCAGRCFICRLRALC